MKFTRRANANWKGTGMEGKGTISTQSTTLDNAQLSFKTRFEQGVGTNPEELIAAAHSGCFTMQLSFLLSEAGFVPEDLDTTAKVTFEDGTITLIQLELTGKVPGISEEDFQKTAQKAKEICPISKLLNTEITLAVTLN
ncbi:MULTISPECIES: OsmC family protein [Flavobacterium]|jgi:osmotically inducible protein OsmC|uniref:Osmotically inducible protein OsmC n=2 Tax=Flavobacterium johnsoniae TaxID=986 RepID=A0A1M5TRI9_FLAJO|nr:MULTISPECIES: OsmC family protein [Flavobacterium]ABQ07036.1 OsmC family protein [Flavobacterium johnsoniae UW101]OXE98757.1 OsmC family peroxiredoxin [Flavobacterium johnsoniae UW101]WDF57753.1 OsmC family protein [Flavobacterium sp. KACC 22758]WQG81129.1 OsmC family protein [Flavobacterium johnsoniae UW101]SHH53013.1 osmotically inducible protein OsmC [Flavobacterium johnsoniae]